MPLIALRPLLDYAAANNFGVAALNVNNMEQIQAIMEAARATQSPAIIQASRGARKYTNDLFLRNLMQAAVELYPEIPIVMHQDHGNSPDTCISAIRMGFTSVMMDGSLEDDGKTPSSYEYNVAVTREVVNVAHRFGVSVEGELGVLGSLEHGMGEKEDGHGAEGKLTLDQLLTDPDQAVDFVNRTGIDALAVAMGTSHGAYKFSRKPSGDVLAMSRIEEIHRKIPNCHLVMHGSSSVPKELCDIINANGGRIKETYGVPVEEIQRGIRAGVRKINVDTDNRLAITGAIRKAFTAKPEEFDPRYYLTPARAAMQAVCEERMKQFGQAGHAKKVPHTTLEQMARDYQAGKYGPEARPDTVIGAKKK
ncbi:fructose-bisphosphate aldolase class II [Myxococcus stipitatus DSM 14675]|uniref:Fructose-1,6-bisphosphate aldolase n=1 Tax=Myxococcus stipitatus (strain DSM 14675 / JCM 12634 / Mx s8) TaxID=1278073 RepID=L7U0J6_MYXSD|nr:class II fructose-bisphosphate aldolase [Myxococcus stipitatus]AGC41395.1 fructose-bisphosphate aldolase class II [Myxococcus stipitatus DSM 14675]